MKNYQILLSEILTDGTDQQNRTGIMARGLPGAMLKFDLRKGFPAITTKKLAFNTMKGELLGFIRGYDNAGAFRDLGCKIWDQNANENKAWLANKNRKGEDDLGRIYGVQWREWIYSSSFEVVDQLVNVVHTILNDPTNRRIIMSAWRPDEFEYMALPPCHVLYQFIVNVEKKELNLCMYQRSCDMFLGVPFNIASASLLLSIIARLTGYTPAIFTHFLADAHIYENHFDQVTELLGREPLDSPTLWVSSHVHELNVSATKGEISNALEAIEPKDIELENYQCHGAIKAPMAV